MFGPNSAHSLADRFIELASGLRAFYPEGLAESGKLQYGYTLASRLMGALHVFFPTGSEARPADRA